MNTSRRQLRLDQVRREALSESLLEFTRYTKRDYRANWHHEVLAEKLDRVAAGLCPRLMVFLPPQHGKSELVSRRFPAFMFGRDPNLRLIACSHTHDMAVRLNADVQRIMAGNAYARLFPMTRLNDRRGRALLKRDVQASKPEAQASKPEAQASGEFRFPRRTQDFFEIPGHRGSLRSAGVGNSIAGNAADGAIIDDPFGKHEDADSPVIREKIWQWYTNDLYSRLSTDAWIVLTHTRWHRDDLAGRLLRKMADVAADQWEVLCLPAVRGEGPADLCDLRTQPGEVLWPQFKSAADLEIIRRQDPRAYAALYQQDPSDASAAEWAAELFGDWLWVPAEKWPPKFDLRVVCVDASKGRDAKAGDYAAIVFLGGQAGSRLLYVDALVDRIPLDQIVSRTIVFCDQHRAEMVGFEAEQFQELLVHEFRRQCGTHAVRCPVYEMMSRGVPKVARIRRLSQYVINRELRFKADSPGCRLLVEQLRDFPFADHDDGPDALEMCCRLPLEVCRPRDRVYSMEEVCRWPW